MRSLHSNPPILRRMQPWLGTFVEVIVTGGSPARRERAVTAAFGRIAEVQRLLSAHDDASELTRLTREAHRGAVSVSPLVTQVLGEAQRLHGATCGWFDVAVGSRLADLGYVARRGTCATAGTTRDILLLPRHQVRFLRPLQIDLGGFAKGVAVDEAVRVLQAGGVSGGVVNAGGDLRAFGADDWPVHVRDPRCPGRLVPLLGLRDAAVATSAAYFSARRVAGRRVSPLIDPVQGRCWTGDGSVSVRAATCARADALTKVALVGTPVAFEVVRSLGGEVFVFSARDDMPQRAA